MTSIYPRSRGSLVRRLLLALFGAALAPAADAAAAPPAGTTLSPVVFIHGIKGAELVDAEGDLAWLSASQALGLSTSELALPTHFEADGSQPRGPLEPRGILAEIPLIPYLYSVDVYGPFLAFGARAGRPFLPFAYDWRRDNDETLLAFERFVVDAAAASPTKKVTAIAHSMGGLMTFALLNKRPELFDGVVFAGVPFRGGIGFLVDLHVGADTGLNSHICGPAALATFPSVFSLFPREHDAVRDVNGNAVATDFYAAADWKRLKLGPYADGRTPPADYDAFLDGALKRARTFRERLVFQPATSYPPVLIVTSKAHKTLVKVVLGTRAATLGVDFVAAPPADGDGRVAFTTSLPPEGLKFEVLETTEDHAALLNDPKVARIALAFPAQP